MADLKKWDIVIIGTGPVGLSLAKQLAMGGIKVLLLEKNNGLSQHSKAITIWPPTQAIFSRMGCISGFEDKALLFEKLTFHNADTNGVLIRFPFHQLRNQTPFPRLLILPQSKTEEILYNSLTKAKNAEILFGAEVSNLEQKEGEVRVDYIREVENYTTTCRILVGCDGGNSFVRKHLNIKLEGETLAQKVALADIRLAVEEEFPSPRLSTREGLYVGFYIGYGIWRLIFILDNKRDLTMEERIKNGVTSLFNRSGFETIWQSEFNLQNRVAEEFAKGNIILAGDAAHLNSPLGGEGMNAGIMDTQILAHALIEVLKTDSLKPLNIYTTERKKSIEDGVNKNTRLLTGILFYRQGKFIKVWLTLLRLVIAVPWLRKKFLMKMTMLD